MTESKNEVRLRAKAAYEPARSNEELLLRWLRRLRESQFSHYEEASRLSRYNFFLGVPVVIVGAVVSPIVIVWVHVLVFPQSSVASYVLVITSGQVFPSLASPTNVIVTFPQLSLAVT